MCMYATIKINRGVCEGCVRGVCVRGVCVRGVCEGCV